MNDEPNAGPGLQSDAGVPAGILAAALTAWIAGARRDLPWRRRRDPYAVWVSEIMLQQTRAATVVPYFERWMARFPTVTTLASAPLGDVLKAWEGLGYYARARNLHRAARELTLRFGGELPGNRAVLLALPGIGRYTAGAILSLAFGQTEPVLDGNVRRVLARLFDVAEDIGDPKIEAILWQKATELVGAAPSGRAGDLNEALMELGALVCVPGVPDCGRCPVAAFCIARARGVQAERPVRARKAPAPYYDVTAGVVQDSSGRYLIVQRPEQGLLGGLWGFPGGVAGAGEELPVGLARALRAQVGIEIEVREPLVQVRHAYTHFRITLHAYRCRLASGEPRALLCADVRWVAPDGLAGYAFPVTDAKVLRTLGLR